MDREKFIETEKIYNQLKEKLDNRLITPDEMKKELKKMMVLDEQGQYWMIGGKTGRWYVYNGSDWKEATPFKESTPAVPIPVAESNDHKNHTAVLGSDLGTMIQDDEEQEADPFSGGTGTREISFDDGSVHTQPVQQPISQTREPVSEAPRIDSSFVDKQETGNDHPQSEYQTKPVSRERQNEGESDPEPQPLILQTDGETQPKTDGPQVNCCLCQSQIPAYALYCHCCGANQKEVPKTASKSKKKKMKKENQGELLITSIRITSLIFFLGGLGLVIGVLVGAGFGIFKDFFVLESYALPQMLEDTRGGIAGGLVFAAIGGIGGFIVSAVGAAILSGIYNAIAYFFGGIRLNINQ